MTEERVKNLNLPQHFTELVSADSRLNPRWLAVGGDGTVYVSGKADVMKTGAIRSDMHGITIHMAGPQWSPE